MNQRQLASVPRWSLVAIAFALIALAASASAQSKLKGVSLEHLDRAVDPCVDFWSFANGAWLKNNEIPADRSSWGAWGELYEANAKEMQGILEEAGASKAAPGTALQKVGDFYSLGLDSAATEAAGIKPLESDLAKIAGMKSGADLPGVIAYLHGYGISGPFDLWVFADSKNSQQDIAQFYQGGLGLPERDYYLSDDPSRAELRSKYIAHIANMLSLLGEEPATAAKNAASIMDFETRLAKVSMTPVQERDPDSTYNKMTLSELSQQAAGFDWLGYFRTRGVSDPGAVNVGQPMFLQEVSRMAADMPIDTWKSYLRWKLLRNASPYLSSAFVNESFDFYGKTLQGRKEQRPRWKRVIAQTNESMGELLGQLFVAKYFPESSKQHVEGIVVNLKAALRDRIAAMDWISETTRQAAFTKLDRITWKIGYPDKWKDYSKLEIKRDSYLQNVWRASKFEADRAIAKINKPVDRSEWWLSPQTVNAYYSASNNEIVFPAAILQPPFFDPNVDDAINYGGIGAVIGHELTHGFDDEGRKYDADGNLRDWWTEEDGKKFEERAAGIRAQYSGYVVADTFRINGELTAGENIADVGGLRIAYHAYKKSLQDKPEPPVMDGFTGLQRFFIGFAHIWRGKIRDQAQIMYLATDPHSPEQYRVLGTLANLPEFAEAFGCKPDAPMMLPTAQQLKIW